MENKKLKRGEEVELFISNLAFGGLGISKVNNLIFFVKNAIPNQTVLAKITKIKKNYIEAYNISTLKKSKDELNVKCDHFKYCGGCSTQQLDYKKQVQYKEEQIYDIFKRIAEITYPKINPIIACERIFNYRNKMEFTFSNRPWFVEDETYDNLVLGLHVPKRFDKILNIDTCHIQNDSFNKILNIVRNESNKNNLEPYDITKHKGFLRYLVLRKGIHTNEIMINIVTSIKKINLLEPIVNVLLKKIKNIKCIVNTINTRKAGITFGEKQFVLFGNNYINERIGNYIFKISPESFFQTNSYQVKILYDYIKKQADLTGNEIIHDLYSGTGTIGLYLSSLAKHIYGFEIIEGATKNALENAKINNVKNSSFYCGDLKDFYNNKMQNIDKPNIIIVDPPRAGLHNNVIQTIINQKPEKFIYISCNPSTQARDVKIFVENNFIVKDIQPIDMFPHTPHIECIITLIYK